MRKKRKAHSPKAYRIYPLYYNLFNACLTIVNRDNLSDYLIRRYYNFKELPRLDSDKDNNLLEKMILDVYEDKENLDTIKNARESPKMIHLQEYYRLRGIDISKPRKSLVIRVSDEIDKIVKELAEECDTIGEVIEIAIAYHITKQSETSNAYFDLITFTIQNQSIQGENQ